MISLIEEKRQELEMLCKRFGVKRLEIFGSAADGTFEQGRSDLDFLVEFVDITPEPINRCYFGMLFGLEELFGLSVDLVMTKAMRNPYFIAAVNASRTMLYEAA